VRDMNTATTKVSTGLTNAADFFEIQGGFTVTVYKFNFFKKIKNQKNILKN
jgi:hypothetical protein